MITTKNTLPENSRVWVYQANRPFSEGEVSELDSLLLSFNSSWEAHGTKLNSAIEIYFNQFIVFFVDEQPQLATGCSIDKSMGLVKSIQTKFSVDLLDRMNITYKVDDRILTVKMSEFQSKVKAGEISESTIVFNNLVESKADFVSNWETTVVNSWHKNLL